MTQTGVGEWRNNAIAPYALSLANGSVMDGGFTFL